MIMMIFLNQSILGSKRAAGTLSYQIRYTSRISRSRQEERIRYVQQKIAANLTSGLGGILTDARLDDILTRCRGVSFRRNRIRVNAMKAILLPLLTLSALRNFRAMFEVYHILLVRLSAFKRSMKLAKKCFGPLVVEGKNIRFTGFLLQHTLSYVRFRKPVWKLSMRQKLFVKSNARAKGLALFLRKGHNIVINSLWRGWLKDIWRTRDNLKAVFLDSREREWSYISDQFIRMFPMNNLILMGDRALGRRQISALYARKAKMYVTVLWTLLINNRIIEKEFFVTSWIKIVVRLTINALTVVTPAQAVRLGFNHRFKFLKPTILSTNEGVPAFRPMGFKENIYGAMITREQMDKALDQMLAGDLSVMRNLERIYGTKLLP